MNGEVASPAEEVSSLKKLAMELVGDWLRLDEGEIESAVLPRLKVGLKVSGLGLVAPTTLLWVGFGMPNEFVLVSSVLLNLGAMSR